MSAKSDSLSILLLYKIATPLKLFFYVLCVSALLQHNDRKDVLCSLGRTIPEIETYHLR